MKKLSELSGDQFMDAFFALSPLLPVLENIDLGTLKDNEKTAEQRGISLFASILAKLLPAITCKENRHCVWELLSILDEVTVEEIKQYPAPKLISKIRKIFAEGELANFMSYAEVSDIVE